MPQSHTNFFDLKEYRIALRNLAKKNASQTEIENLLQPTPSHSDDLVNVDHINISNIINLLGQFYRNHKLSTHTLGSWMDVIVTVVCDSETQYIRWDGHSLALVANGIEWDRLHEDDQNKLSKVLCQYANYALTQDGNWNLQSFALFLNGMRQWWLPKALYRQLASHIHHELERTQQPAMHHLALIANAMRWELIPIDESSHLQNAIAAAVTTHLTTSNNQILESNIMIFCIGLLWKDVDDEIRYQAHDAVVRYIEKTIDISNWEFRHLAYICKRIYWQDLSETLVQRTQKKILDRYFDYFSYKIEEQDHLTYLSFLLSGFDWDVMKKDDSDYYHDQIAEMALQLADSVQDWRPKELSELYYALINVRLKWKTYPKLHKLIKNALLDSLDREFWSSKHIYLLIRIFDSINPRSDSLYCAIQKNVLSYYNQQTWSTYHFASLVIALDYKHHPRRRMDEVLALFTESFDRDNSGIDLSMLVMLVKYIPWRDLSDENKHLQISLFQLALSKISESKQLDYGQIALLIKNLDFRYLHSRRKMDLQKIGINDVFHGVRYLMNRITESIQLNKQCGLSANDSVLLLKYFVYRNQRVDEAREFVKRLCDVIERSLSKDDQSIRSLRLFSEWLNPKENTQFLPPNKKTKLETLIYKKIFEIDRNCYKLSSKERSDMSQFFLNHGDIERVEKYHGRERITHLDVSQEVDLHRHHFHTASQASVHLLHNIIKSNVNSVTVITGWGRHNRTTNKKQSLNSITTFFSHKGFSTEQNDGPGRVTIINHKRSDRTSEIKHSSKRIKVKM